MSEAMLAASAEASGGANDVPDHTSWYLLCVTCFSWQQKQLCPRPEILRSVVLYKVCAPPKAFGARRQRHDGDANTLDMEEIDPLSDEVLDWLPVAREEEEEDARTLQSGSVPPACVAIRFALPSMPDLFANQLLAFALHDGAPVLNPRPDDALDSAMLHYRVHGWTVIPSLLSEDFFV